MKTRFVFFALSILLGTAACAEDRTGLVFVNVPFLKVMNQSHDGVETEALLGEPLRILSRNGVWYHVSLPWQTKNAAGTKKLVEYQGWVRLFNGAIVTNNWSIFPGSSHFALVGSPEDRGMVPVWQDAQGTRGSRIGMGVVLPAAKNPNISGRRALLLPDGRIIYAAVNKIVQWGSIDGQQLGGTLVKFASWLIGLPYVWGGNNASGVDCSGLIVLAARCAGRLIPRDTYPQFDHLPPVLQSDLMPGDMIFYHTDRNNPTSVSHVALLANTSGAIIHGYTTAVPIKYDRLDNPLLRNIVAGYRRIK